MSAEPKEKPHSHGWPTQIYVLGYGLTYVPFLVLTSATKDGLLPGQTAPVAGWTQLPVLSVGWALAALVVLLLLGWWRYLPRRRFLGMTLALPSPAAATAGVATATILVTTVAAYTAPGSSVLIAGIVTRASVLILAPIMDALHGRRVRKKARIGFLLAAAAVPLATKLNGGFSSSAPFVAALAGYVAAYTLRFSLLNRTAKTSENRRNWEFMVGEHVSSAASLLLFGTVFLVLDPNSYWDGIFAAGGRMLLCWLLLAALAAELVGLFAGLTLVAPEENTYCVPLNRAAGVVSSCLATCLAALWWNQSAPRVLELVAAALTIAAIAILAAKSDDEQAMPAADA